MAASHITLSEKIVEFGYILDTRLSPACQCFHLKDKNIHQTFKKSVVNITSSNMIIYNYGSYLIFNLIRD